MEIGREPVVTTALIIGDVQQGITSSYPFTRQVVPPLTELLPRARASGALVVFVHFALRINGADLPPGQRAIQDVLRSRGRLPRGIGRNRDRSAGRRRGRRRDETPRQRVRRHRP